MELMGLMIMADLSVFVSLSDPDSDQNQDLIFHDLILLGLSMLVDQ